MKEKVKVGGYPPKSSEGQIAKAQEITVRSGPKVRIIDKIRKIIRP